MRGIQATVAVVLLAFSGARAQDAWLASRQTDFAVWQKNHRGIEARIAILKVKTAKLTAGHTLGPVTAPAIVYRVKGAPTQLWDGPEAPHLTVVPAGEFTMGSPASEPGRAAAEGPQHRVAIGYAFAAGTFMVTRDEYAAFVADTRRSDPDGCWLTFKPGEKGEAKGYNWHNPGFAQTGRDPVVCVSWEDARDYAAWLSAKTGRAYRLLSEAEWEYASRGGSAAARPWGDGIDHARANYGTDKCCAPLAAGNDRWEFTSPVGSFPPNAFGLYDVLGNAWQRLDDCWNATFDGAPADGSVWRTGDCTKRTGHGGAFDSEPSFLRAAFRGSVPGTTHFADGTFRIARDL